VHLSVWLGSPAAFTHSCIWDISDCSIKIRLFKFKFNILNYKTKCKSRIFGPVNLDQPRIYIPIVWMREISKHMNVISKGSLQISQLLILTVHNISAVTFKIRTAIVNININNIPWNKLYIKEAYPMYEQLQFLS
jgi:hypothetical protein